MPARKRARQPRGPDGKFLPKESSPDFSAPSTSPGPGPSTTPEPLAAPDTTTAEDESFSTLRTLDILSQSRRRPLFTPTDNDWREPTALFSSSPPFRFDSPEPVRSTESPEPATPEVGRVGPLPDSYDSSTMPPSTMAPRTGLPLGRPVAPTAESQDARAHQQESPAPPAATPAPPVSPQLQGPYTHQKYLTDAIWIRLAKSEVEANHCGHLRNLLTPDLCMMAVATVRAMTGKDRRLREAKANQALNQKKSPFSVNDFTALAKRFQAGPTDVPDDEEELQPLSPDRRRQAEDPLESPSRRRRQEQDPAPRVLAAPPAFNPGGPAYHPGAYYNPAAYHPGAYYNPGGYPFHPPGLNPNDPFSGESPPWDGGYQQRNGQSFRRQDDIPHDNRSLPQSRGQQQDARPGRRSFKAELLAFDSTKTSVSAYISKIEWLSGTHGEETVLENIVPGLLSSPNSDGCHWFESLSELTRQRLRTDLSGWKTLLIQRFRKDRGSMITEADQLSHSFADESSLPLQTYIDKKVSLYNEAGDVDEDQIARRIVLGLDPALAKLVDVRYNRLTVDDVKMQITSREYAARRDWDGHQKEFSAMQAKMESRIETLIKEKDRKPARAEWTPRYQSRDDTRPDDKTNRYGSNDNQGYNRNARWNDRQSFRRQDDRRESQPFRRQDDRQPFRRQDDRRESQPFRRQDERNTETKPLGPISGNRQPVTLSRDQYKQVFGKDTAAPQVKAYMTELVDDDCKFEIASDCDSYTEVGDRQVESENEVDDHNPEVDR